MKVMGLNNIGRQEMGYIMHNIFGEIGKLDRDGLFERQEAGNHQAQLKLEMSCRDVRKYFFSL